MAIVEVIKYSGNPDVFAWKYPGEELGTWSQLIVNESQEAVLFKGGQALDVFAAGRHTLSTANIPLLSKLVNLPFGGRSPFTAEVWYINKVFSLDIKWGTPTPIQLQDPKYKVFIPLRSFGQFGIQISDSKPFLTKLVGTLPQFDKENILKYFRGLYLTKVKDAISSYLIKKGVSVLEINAYLDELSGFLKEAIMPTMEEYGIKLVNFYVNDVNVPEDDPAVKKLKDALAKRAEMDIVGYNYVQERSFNTLEGAANNPGSAQSGLMGAGIGLGMGLGVGGAVGGQFAGLAQNINVSGGAPGGGVPDGEPTGWAAPTGGTQGGGASGGGAQGRGAAAGATAGASKSTTTCSKCGTIYSKKYKFCPECSDPYNPCPACGSDMNIGATECPACGKAPPKRCPKCNTVVDNDDSKFCHQCGESLIKKCEGCGARIEGIHKFCPECGRKILTDG